MAKVAMVTGATAGIGASFSHLLAREGFDVILVARDQARLKERARDLSVEFNVKCEVICADLYDEDGIALVEARLNDSHNPVNVLINNAGFALKESFLKTDLAAELRLFDVLARTPMRLMHAVLPAMKARDEGTIINVASVAAWTTGGSYSAAKSYITVLSESVHTELRGSHVEVLALCPGFTHTEFHQRAKMNMRGLPEMFWLSADAVAAQAWSDAKAGKAISIPGRQYKILSTVARFGPRPLVRKLGMRVRVKQRSK